MVCGSSSPAKFAPGVSHDPAMSYAAEVFRAALPRLPSADVNAGRRSSRRRPKATSSTRRRRRGAGRMVDHPQWQAALDCKAMSSESATIPDIPPRQPADLGTSTRTTPTPRPPASASCDLGRSSPPPRDGYNVWVSGRSLDYTPGTETADIGIARLHRRCEVK